MLGDHDRQRIGLFAGGCGGAPHPQRTALGSGSPAGRWQQVAGQELEVGRFPEEAGVVGRDEVDKLLGLLVVARAQESAVVVVACEPEAAEPAGETSGHECPLVGPEADPAAAVDEVREKRVGPLVWLGIGGKHERMPGDLSWVSYADGPVQKSVK